MSTRLDKEFFAQETVTVARSLLGVTMSYQGCEGIIVETEAYREDAASHAVTKPNKGALLRETYGCIYIFFIYGMYHCLNFTTEKEGVGAVLIRAVEPLRGIELMKARRGTDEVRNLTNGPGKLFTAFGFDPGLHGEPIAAHIQLRPPAAPDALEIVSGPRVGISKARHLPWRFFVKGNHFVSRAVSSKRV
ncbi:MAG: DNA-3-methyladenine glycosylase [Calditrichaeota bacterium]|nr:MAG: DNA-3-methyladenine glycosylase [Calditrichota bacterium]